jgi:proton glutamate symport protein
VSGTEAATVVAPTFSAWLQALVPANPLRAAVDDAVLPLVVFAVFFGFAATRLSKAPRDLVVNVFRAIGEVMIVIVRWVLLAGPIGVFALALGVGARAGLAAAGTLFHYIAIAVLVTLGITIIGYVLAILAGRMPVRTFTVAAAPVWAIAFSTQSSLASLPAMLEAARTGLGISARVTDLVLPLAVAVFRLTSPVTNLVVALFIAEIYGIDLTSLQLTAGVVTALAVSIAAVGLPGQVSFITSMAPICLAMGLPLDLLGVLLAVEVMPDIFRTLGNVTGDLAATTILRERRAFEAPLTPR